MTFARPVIGPVGISVNDGIPLVVVTSEDIDGMGRRGSLKGNANVPEGIALRSVSAGRFTEAGGVV